MKFIKFVFVKIDSNVFRQIFRFNQYIFSQTSQTLSSEDS